MGTIGALIVDDQPDVRLLIRLIIEDADAELFVTGEAASGEEALERLEELDPGVVILDYVMPQMDGLETARRIVARRPGLPVILCTAFLDEEVRSLASKAGVRACISKAEFFRLPQLVREAVAPGHAPRGEIA